MRLASRRCRVSERLFAQITVTEVLERRVLLSAIPVVNWVRTFEHLHGADMVMDSAGDVYVAGSVTADGQMAGGFDSTWGQYGVPDGFVAKFRPDGSMVWGSYLGGAGTDVAQAIGLDGAGNVYVGGDPVEVGIHKRPLICPYPRRHVRRQARRHHRNIARPRLQHPTRLAHGHRAGADDQNSPAGQVQCYGIVRTHQRCKVSADGGRTQAPRPRRRDPLANRSRKVI